MTALETILTIINAYQATEGLPPVTPGDLTEMRVLGLRFEAVAAGHLALAVACDRHLGARPDVADLDRAPDGATRWDVTPGCNEFTVLVGPPDATPEEATAAADILWDNGCELPGWQWEVAQ